MRTGIYAIRDIKADDIIGGLHMHKHHAAAIRMFSDIAADEKTYISKHPEDYELLRLGYLDLDGTPPIAPELQTIITGVQWAAMQQQPVPEPTNQRSPELQEALRRAPHAR